MYRHTQHEICEQRGSFHFDPFLPLWLTMTMNEPLKKKMYQPGIEYTKRNFIRLVQLISQWTTKTAIVIVSADKIKVALVMVTSFNLIYASLKIGKQRENIPFRYKIRFLFWNFNHYTNIKQKSTELGRLNYYPNPNQ